MVSSVQLGVNDAKLAPSGMMTFRSWAEECDSESTSPKHGDNHVI